ncbi:MAG TPA: sn-glycerol-3-phosphate ABC transporter ATP-binding protein UgpC [Gaiellaceae bacterium]|nr:sn-glycerol-3-phosphate ABC transporter ATP-binding protein UgpC [Gaiellaceae bacterium]
MADVVFTGAGKVYPNGTRALADFDLHIHDGEFMVFVGPSGCGKTTALRMTAGLEPITEGEIRIGDRVVNKLEPQERDVAMVFQNYALYPHMTVRDNIAFGLKMRKVPRDERQRRVEEIGRVLGLGELLDRKPRHLSGGQRQRVAMGRAIVREPAAFLMDEPLSNLDARLRVQMRAEISRIQRDVGATTIYVTHDQVEAMTMGDRVTVLRKGQLQQVDEPQALFDAPANLFVASFIGSPEMNLLEGEIERSGDGIALRLGSNVLPVPARETLASRVGERVAIGIRPEYTAPATRDEPRLDARLVVAEPLGSETLLHAEVSVVPVLSQEVLEVVLDTDAAVAADLEAAAADRRSPFRARFPGTHRGATGDPLSIAVDVERLYFFDLRTGAAIA